MSPATHAGRCRIPVATVLALLASGALAGVDGRSVPPVGGAASERVIRAEPAEVDTLLETMRRDMAAPGGTRRRR